MRSMVPACGRLMTKRAMSSSDNLSTSSRVCARILDMYKPVRQSAIPSRFVQAKEAPDVDTNLFSFKGQKLPQIELETDSVKSAQRKALGSLYLSYIVSHHIVTQRGYISYRQNKLQRAKFVELLEKTYKTDLMLLAGHLVLRDREEADGFFRAFFRYPAQPWTANEQLSYLAPYRDVINYDVVWSDKLSESLIPKYPKDKSFHVLMLGSSDNVNKVMPIFYSQQLDAKEIKNVIKGIERHGRLAFELNLEFECINAGKKVKMNKTSLAKVAPFLLQASMLQHVSRDIQWQGFVSATENPWPTICGYFGLLDIHGVDLQKVASKTLEVLGSQTDPTIAQFLEECPLEPVETAEDPFGALSFTEGFQDLINNCTDENFKSDLVRIGAKLIKIAPVFYNLQAHPFSKPGDNRALAQSLASSLAQDETIRAIAKQHTVTEEIIVAAQFILDPCRCLPNLVGYLSTNSGRANFHDSVRNYVIKEKVPPISVNSSCLELQSAELGLPPVLDKSIVAKTIMINASLTDAYSAPSYLRQAPLNDCLLQAAKFGEVMYKLFLERSLLSTTDADLRKMVFKFLTSDQYYRFLLENVGFFGTYFKDKTILKALFAKKSSRDLFAKQIGQYFTVVYFDNPVACEKWVERVADIYKGVLENMSNTEIHETLNALRKAVNKQETYFDTLSRTSVKQKFDDAFENLIQSFKASKPIEEYDDDLMINQATSLISYYVYHHLFSHELFTFTTRHDACMDEISKMCSDRNSLKQIGIYISESNIDEASEAIERFVKQLLGNQVKAFDPNHLPQLPRTTSIRISGITPVSINYFEDYGPIETFWEKVRMPVAEERVYINTILGVNSAVSISFFKSLNLNYSLTTRLSEAIKKLAIMGQSYYKFIVRYHVSRLNHLSSEERVEITRIVTKKAFKTRVLAESDLIQKAVRDSQYWALIRKRADNTFNLLKVGSTAFDQNIVRMLYTNPKQLNEWVENMVSCISPASSSADHGATSGFIIESDQIEESLERYLSNQGSSSKKGK